jgi:hypothetical protein
VDDLKDNSQAQEQKKDVPLHARLFWYLLEPAELLALKGMVEHCSNGSVIYPSIRRLSAYTKLSKKQLQRLIHGWDERKKAKKIEVVSEGDPPPIAADGKKSREKQKWEWVVVKHHAGFLERGILTERAKSNRGEYRPATYQLNEGALEIDPKMREWIAQDRQGVLPGVERHSAPGGRYNPPQKNLPGMRPPTKPRQRQLSWQRGKPSTPSDTMSLAPPSDTMSHGTPPPLATPCRMSSDIMSPYPLIDPRRGESVEGFGVFPGVEIVKVPSDPSTTDTVLPELSKGLREILPLLDDAAIQQIWIGCRSAAPDCTVDEVISFAWQKAPALERAHNPTGLLIHSVPQLFSPEILKTYRQRRQQEQEEYKAAEQQRIQQEADSRLYIEAYGRTEGEAKEQLAQMPATERTALRGVVTAAFHRNCPNAGRLSEDVIEKTMVRDIQRRLLQEAGFKW